jgi:4-carboxymuconolactone decarboxylase
LPRLKRFKRADLNPDQAALYDSIVGERPFEAAAHVVGRDGALEGPLNARLLSPGVGHAAHKFAQALIRELTLPVRARELAILTCAHVRGSDYVWGAHRTIALTVGIRPEEIDAIAEERTPATLSLEERAIVSAAASLAREGDLDDEQYAEAVVALGERQLFEIVMLIGQYSALGLQTKVYRVSYE